MAVFGTARWLSVVSLLALGGCQQSDVKLAAESVYQQCGRRLDYDGCQTRLWKRDYELAGRFMGYFGEQEVILGPPLHITYHDEERTGSDGRGPYVESFSTLQGTKGKATGILRFTKVENRWLMTRFTFEPMQ